MNNDQYSQSIAKAVAERMIPHLVGTLQQNGIKTVMVAFQALNILLMAQLDAQEIEVTPEIQRDIDSEAEAVYQAWMVTSGNIVEAAEAQLVSQLDASGIAPVVGGEEPEE
jgi:hypothetical protein